MGTCPEAVSCALCLIGQVAQPLWGGLGSQFCVWGVFMSAADQRGALHAGDCAIHELTLSLSIGYPYPLSMPAR